jgi:hypothetical protein
MSVFSSRMFIVLRMWEEKNFMFTLLLYIYICLHVGSYRWWWWWWKLNYFSTTHQKKRDLSIQLFYVYKDDNLHDDWLFESTYRTALKRKRIGLRLSFLFFLWSIPPICVFSFNQTKARVDQFSLVNIYFSSS